MTNTVLKLVQKMRRRSEQNKYVKSVRMASCLDTGAEPYTDHEFHAEKFNADLDALEAEIHSLLAKRRK